MLHARKPDGSRLNVVVDADVQASTCGYCKSDADTSVSHGMVSLGMTVQVYQDLLDLGWRRSGCYLYKPDCTATCCPPYTIRMHANQFQVNKKQRQLQRKWQRFLAGEYDLPDPMHAKQQEQQQEEQQEEQQQQQQQVQRRHKAQRKRQQQQESQQQQQQHCPLGAGGCVDLVGHVEQLLAAAVQELVHEGRLPPVRVLLLPSGLHARAQAEYPAARLLPLKTKAKKSTISTPILWPLTSKLCEGDETRVSGSVTIDGSGVEQGASCHSSVTHQGPGARSEVACASVTKGRCKSNGGSTLDMEEQHWPRAGAGGAQGVAPATGWSCAITFAIAAVAAKAMRKGCQGRGHQLVQRVAPPPCYLHLVSQPPQQQQEQQQQQQEEEQQPQEQQEQQCWLHATPGEAVQGQSHQGRCSTATLPSCSKVVQSPAAGGGPGGAGAGGQLAVALAPPSPQDLACLLLTAMHHAVPVSQLVDTAGKVLVLLPLPGEVLPPESMQSPKQSGTLPGASHSPGLCVWASGGYLNIAPCLPSAQPHAQIARGSQTGTQQMDGAGLGGRPCTACPPASSCATLRRQGKGPRVSEAEHAPGTTSVPAAGAGAAAGVRAGAGAGDECEGQAVVTLSPLLVATPPVAQASSPPRNYEVLTLPSTFIEEEYQLYRRYQIQHHGDNPDDITRDSYTRFLVHTPLLPQGPSQSPTSAPAHTTSPLPCTGPTLTAATQTETPAPCAGSSGSGPSAAQGSSPAASDAPGCGFGSFHQQYRVDGQLVAVGVVDVLPRCLSGVYLFWDKAWAALAPGQWTALEEIRWVQEASRRCPSLQYYYMGYYIHTCPRMRYKADYQPADLLCPETKLWVRCDPDILEAIQQQPGAPLAHLPGALLSPNHAPLGWAAPVAAGTPSLATGQATGQPSGHTAAAGPSGTGTAADQAVQPAAAVSAAAGTGQGEQGLALDPGGTPSQSSQARPADSHNGSGTYHAPAAGASPVVGDKSLTKVKGGGVGRHRLVDGVPVSALDEVLLVVDTSAVTWQLAKQLGVVKPKHWALLDSLLAAWLRLVGGVAPQLGYKLS